MKNYKVGDEILVKVQVVEVDAYDDSGRKYKVDPNYEHVNGYIFWAEDKRIVDIDKTYEDGLRDAWEMARKYILMSEDERHEIFNGITNPGYFFNKKHMTAQQAIDKYNEMVIKPGDVVYIMGESNLNSKYTILAINKDTAYGYGYVDDIFKVQNLSFAIGNMQKTGEHVDLSFLTSGGAKKEPTIVED